MSVWEWLEWERKCLELNSGGFRFNVSFVDYTFVSITLSLRGFLVSPIYCKLQRLQGFGQIFGRTNFYLGVKRPQEKQCLCKILGWQKKCIMVSHGIFWSGQWCQVGLKTRPSLLSLIDHFNRRALSSWCNETSPVILPFFGVF